SDPEERKKAFLRHTGFFNTHPYFASLIVGVVLRKEEEYSETGKEEILRDIKNWKLNLAGPLAALGDSLIWSLWRPLTAIAAIFLFFTGEDFPVYYPVLIFLVGYNLLPFFIRWRGLIEGYRYQEAVFKWLEGFSLPTIYNLLRLFGIALAFFLFVYLFFFSGFGIFSLIHLALLILFVILAHYVSVEVLFYLLVIIGFILGMVRA
ncbi:MAG TPA: PTS system mannose/fructose/sorbose family transporter subunit IID, partial [bacterium]|nr:PTS system mannose/fructose/sorbose family transporter subunit IID [bacterium]